MGDIAEFAAHLQQAARRVVAVLRVGGVGQHFGQLTDVHFDIVVVEQCRFAVNGRVAQFIGLDGDSQIVRRGWQVDADQAGDIEDGTGLDQDATRGCRVGRGARCAGTDRDLPAIGDGQRTRLEIHHAASGDLDPGFILLIRQANLIVE